MLQPSTALTLDDLILSHHFSRPAPGDVTLRTALWEVRWEGQVVGMVAATDRDDARSAAADRFGGDADAYSVRYLRDVVETFAAEEVEDAA